MSRREDVLGSIGSHLIARCPGHPLRVGVDGVCGSGKSTFTRELMGWLQSHGQVVVHLDSDGFHHPRVVRYRRGRRSARGYYEDAYDFGLLAERVLEPLGPGGSLTYAPRVHDMTSDQIISGETAVAEQRSVVLFDCTFLQRGSLRELWDEVIFLDVDRAIAAERGIARDASRLGGADAAQRAFDERYMAACDIYIEEERPVERSSILLDNNDLAAPVVLKLDPGDQ